MSSTAQKKAIKDFKAVTGVSDKVAKENLTRNQYNLEQALDAFFNSGANSAPVVSKSATEERKQRLDKYFDKYASPEEKDVMFDDKFAEFFSDHDVDPEGPMTLAFSWKLSCKTVGECSRQDFVNGLSALNCDTKPKIKAMLSAMTNQLATNNQQFRDFYRWVFMFFLGQDRKTLDKDQALELWELVLTGHFSLLPQFLAFVDKDEETKFVNKDLWDQVYDFAAEIKADLSNWEDDGAWPVTIDDFVASQQKA